MAERKTAHQRGYGSRWQKARLGWLHVHPLCEFCELSGRIEIATVVDHKIPHKGDMKLFWDRNNWQSLCKSCHDGTKKRIEHGSLQQTIGLDGWPIDQGES